MFETSMGVPLSVPRRLLTVEEYYRLGEAGVLSENDRIELIEGEMIEMAPIGGPHMNAVNQFVWQFTSQLQGSGIISAQNPVMLPPRNVPQPDITILSPDTLKALSIPTASDVLLLIEVVHTTMKYDRDVKAPIYARAGIEEVWLWDVQAHTLSIYLQSSPHGYQKITTAGKDDCVMPSKLPNVTIRLSEFA